MKGKRFVSRGEEFFDYLKELGYQPPKHLTFEHFEYLFQDEDMAGFVQKIMSLKAANSLSPEEIEKFEVLKAQNTVLYGSDLEEAVKRHHSVLEIRSRNQNKQQGRIEELQQRLLMEKEELQRLKNLETNLVASDQLRKESRNTKVMDVLQRFTKENQMESEITLQLLAEKMRQLETSTLHLLRAQDDTIQEEKNKSTRYICNIEGARILENEEEVFQMVVAVLRNHAPGLMMKVADCNVEGDPLHAENVRKIFLQYKKNFDRVKHCTLYEKMQELSYETAIAMKKRCLDNFDECRRRATHVSPMNSDVQRQHGNNITGLFNSTTQHYNNQPSGSRSEPNMHQAVTFQRVKDLTVLSLGKQFSDLTNIKSLWKKELERFFIVITNVLKAQKVRLALVRNLDKSESQLYARLMGNFEENLFTGSKVKKPSILKREKTELTFEGQILHFVFSNLVTSGNCMDILNCPHRIDQTITNIYKQLDVSRWSKLEERRTSFTADFKLIGKTVDLLHQMQERSSIRLREGSGAFISKLNNENNELQERLEKFKLTRTTLVKESMKVREANLRKMKDVLS